MTSDPRKALERIEAAANSGMHVWLKADLVTLRAALDDSERMAVEWGEATATAEIAEEDRDKAVMAYVKAEARAEAAEARVKELVALLCYDHSSGCAALVTPGAKCNCPWEADVNHTERLEAQVKELERERDEANAKGAQLMAHGFDLGVKLHDAEKARAAAEAEAGRLATAIDRALHELGVPQPGYPAPVANAVEILRAALAAREGKP